MGFILRGKLAGIHQRGFLFKLLPWTKSMLMNAAIFICSSLDFYNSSHVSWRQWAEHKNKRPSELNCENFPHTRCFDVWVDNWVAWTLKSFTDYLNFVKFIVEEVWEEWLAYRKEFLLDRLMILTSVGLNCRRSLVDGIRWSRNLSSFMFSHLSPSPFLFCFVLWKEGSYLQYHHHAW